jgi:hypothetical protein
VSEEAKNEIYRRYVEYCRRIGVKPQSKQEYEANLRYVPNHATK